MRKLPLLTFLACAMAFSIAPHPAFAAQDLPRITATYALGVEPTALAVTAQGTYAVTANAGPATASIINLATGVISTVSVGTSPRGVVTTPDGISAYVSNYVADSVSVINIAQATATTTISNVQDPGSGIVSGDGQTVLIPNGGLVANTITKISTASNTTSGTISATVPGCLTASPDGDTFYTCLNTATSAGIGTVSSGTVTAVSLTAGSPGSSGAFSPDGATLYVTQYNADSVAVIDVANRSLRRTTAVGDRPNSIAVSPDGSRVFVADGNSNSLSILGSDGALLSTTSVSAAPQEVAVSNDGQYVLVTTTNDSLEVFDATGSTLLTSIALGGFPRAMKVSPTGNFAVIAVEDIDSVLTISLPPRAALGPQVPTAAMQQFGRAFDQGCSTAPTDLADFPALGPAVRNDGWGASWAQWPNGGTGGFVCTRQPYYTTRGAWGVR